VIRKADRALTRCELEAAVAGSRSKRRWQAPAMLREQHRDGGSGAAPNLVARMIS
jgi:hypothetical protein